ncbi:beta-galactosidase-1-like protein 2 [Daphnia pulicaria]|uniref:beta-galactosidase-1-like protein 2 n=1 Tax=Daphnia pulicaria TaxID=35523 RepID=UPI001EEABC39|nr:beta-galactosidase-1-like protein 2 [Daphnia pulicaria]
MIKFSGFFVCLLPLLALAQNDVTWYDYYTAGGRTSGLIPASKDGFLLNGKPFHIISGAVHYFRIHPTQWRDRLRKLRAVGANTVETYMPWNLHEPRRGDYDFSEGQNDLSAFLNVTAFVEMAQEEDLFVILRPGPYICSEWDFGGLPSWLLRDPEMKVRTSYPGYLQVADDYLTQVFSRVVNLQFQKGDGPIIAFQVENEYGAFGVGDEPRDTEYLIHLRDKMIELGATEMFFTSDTPTKNGDLGAVPGELQTANFQNNADPEFDALDILQPDKPYMVAEFWSGWFDHWGQGYHGGSSLEEFSYTLERIFTRNSSVNFYMFIGGTSFGFMNGANQLPVFPFYAADISSYDYDAPLTEAGDYTDKYYAAKDLIAQFNRVPNIYMPALPVESVKTAYPEIQTTEHLTLEDLLLQLPSNLVIQSDNVLAMEDLPINNDNGQSYGYILYRNSATLTGGSHTIQTIGHVRDLAVLMLDQQRLTSDWKNDAQLNDFGFWPLPNRTFDFNADKGDATYVVDLLVENMARNNFGPPSYFYQKRGLPEGPVLLDNEEVVGWTMFPLEFTSVWVRSLKNWNNSPAPPSTANSPTLTKATLSISGDPTDTFITTVGWGDGNRGVVFVNGFNIGRYSGIGPTKTLYIPAPLLNRGDNTILVWSLFEPVTTITFSDQLDLGLPIQP